MMRKKLLCMQTSTDYGPYLANEPSPLHTTTVVDRCTEKLVDDWNKLRMNVRLLLFTCYNLTAWSTKPGVTLIHT